MGIRGLGHYIKDYIRTKKYIEPDISKITCLNIDINGIIHKSFSEDKPLEESIKAAGLNMKNYVMQCMFKYPKARINVFLDFSLDEDMIFDKIYFKKFFPKNENNKDIYDPVIEKSLIYDKDGKLNEFKIQYINVSSVRNLIELSKRYQGQNIIQKSKYISLRKITNLCMDTASMKTIDHLNELYDQAWYRCVIREAKHKIKQTPSLKSKFSSSIREIIKVSNLPVNFYGCGVEADYAMLNYIKKHNEYYHMIISQDTDMFAHFGDIDCIINFNDILINPIQFWKHLFKFTFTLKDIKMLCVLKKIDYNSNGSIINEDVITFDSILSKLNIDPSSKTPIYDLEDRINHLFEISEVPINQKISTAIAMNMYLNPLETNIMEL